jgi:hypothetical protein
MSDAQKHVQKEIEKLAKQSFMVVGTSVLIAGLIALYALYGG